jgi:hypothetical protein
MWGRGIEMSVQLASCNDAKKMLSDITPAQPADISSQDKEYDCYPTSILLER